MTRQDSAVPEPPLPPGVVQRTPRMDSRRDWQEAKRRASGIQPVKRAECGTPSAYRRHLRQKRRALDYIAAGFPDAKVDGDRTAAEVAAEPECAACLDAWNRNARERRQAKKARDDQAKQTAKAGKPKRAAKAARASRKRTAKA